MTDTNAPGWPGIPARWTSSAKAGVGTALGADSRVWFTLSHGILNELYFPRIDHACVRDMGLVVSAAEGFLSEEKRHATHAVVQAAPGAPAYNLTNSCLEGRYRIHKEIVSDPMRPALLQRTRFEALQGSVSDYHLHVLLAPHLNNRGDGNNGWLGDHKGIPMLFAQRDGTALALACSVPWVRRSVGYVGHSDAWQDLVEHGEMTWAYDRADNGNIALAGAIDLPRDGSPFVLAVAFGGDAAEAGHRARASLQDGFDRAKSVYVSGWRDWQASLLALDDVPPDGVVNEYRVSTAVLRTHEAVSFPGGMIASLSVPWGFSKGDDDLGGYHLVWPRDAVESAGALLAAGALDDARRVLGYLATTQEADGRWGQNMWLDGTPYWSGIQMDETALPVLLVDLARREGALDQDECDRFWPMVRRAASFIVSNGPVSPQDRWEEDAGYSPFTVAAEIAALLVAAEMAERNEAALAPYLRETADAWNACIDQWMYAAGTDRAARFDVDGYYVRVAPVDTDDGVTRFQAKIAVKNVPLADSMNAAAAVISPDALALVRFGLRRADDPRIQNTVRLIDAVLKLDTPLGPCWHRYNGDGYGEHADGSPFDGTGIGRAWPLLTGERAHFELAAGDVAKAEQLRRSFAAFANEGGLLPEQTWDSADLPDRELFFGRPAGSAMPLVWAHAEYVKLLRSLRDGRVFDLPQQTVQRYLVDNVPSPRSIWSFSHKIRDVVAGMMLRVTTMDAARIHWTRDHWSTVEDAMTTPSGLGPHWVDLPTMDCLAGTQIEFTMYWLAAGRWEGNDFSVSVTAPGEG